MTRTTLHKPDPRHAFSWGFHDGADAALKNRTPEWQPGQHPYPTYEAGYRRGHALASAGQYDPLRTTSTAAWEVFSAEVTAQARKAPGQLTELAPGVFTTAEPGVMIPTGDGRFIRAAGPRG